MSASAFKQKLSKVGVWSMELRFGPRDQALEAAAELEHLGYSALWVPGGIGGDICGDVGQLVAATKSCVIGTGIINIWKHEPSEISSWWVAQPAHVKERALLGLGISHGPLIGESYGKPVATMRDYVGKLRAQGVAASSLCLAALGPKMLELARDETAGAHPYLGTVEHTAAARKILGPDALLAPELGVVLETDPARARAICRDGLATYRHLPNYVNNWRRHGFGEADTNELSDALIDALFAWGDAQQIAARVREHFDAGADHVCVQVVTGALRMSPELGAVREAWRELARVLV
jgi:probable F420-dependent oxidoreductase